MSRQFTTLVFTILLLIGSVWADDQTGVAIDFHAKLPVEIRLLSDGMDANVTFGQHIHSNFIADFEVDRISGQTTISPSLGYQVFTDYKRLHLHPYVYGGLGSTTTINSSTVVSGTLGQGADFRLNRHISLRFEHEFDYARQEAGQWTHRYTGILVWRIGNSKQ